jgi:hypothetical protein
MYKIHLKRRTSHDSEIEESIHTKTLSPAAAEAAFRELISRKDLKKQCAAAVLSLNNRQLMYHRFDRSSSYANHVGPDDEIKLFHDEN